MRTTYSNKLLSVGYVWIALVGTGLVTRGGVAAAMAGTLLLLVAVGGATLIWSDSYLPRHRPAVELGTAPSGAPAMVFGYPRVALLLPVCWTAAFLTWSTLGAVLSLRAGHLGGAWVLGTLAAVLLWPLVALLRAKVVVGGLYLTSVGLEYRHEGLGWSATWDSLEFTGPHAARRAGDELMIGFHRPPERHDTTKVVWRREVRLKRPVVFISAHYIAGGASVLTDLLARCRDLPQTRGTLAQGHTVDQLNEQIRARAPRTARTSATPAP